MPRRRARNPCATSTAKRCARRTRETRARCIAGARVTGVPAAKVDVWTLIGPSRIDASGGGLATGVLFHMAIPAADPNTLYVSSTTSGVWASADRGNSWRDATGDLPALSIFALAVDAANPSHVFAVLGNTGIYASGNGGGSWTRVGGPPSTMPAITDLVVDPTNAQNLYVRANSAIYRSTDGGASWQVSFGGATSHLIMAPGDSRTLYAGVPGIGIIRTRDSGATWTVLTPGLTTTTTDVRVAPSPVDPAVIYGRFRGGPATVNEIWRSTDGGNSWTLQSTPAVYLSVIKADATAAGRLYVAGVDFFRSDDGGATWVNKPGAHVDHHDCAHDPARPADIYTACDGGLYRATQAENWEFVANGIANVEFYDLAIATQRPELAIGGTQDNGTLITDGSALEWGKVSGGDGGTVAIDPSNAQVMYVMNQYATSIARSVDGGASFVNIGTGLPTGAACFNLRYGVHPNDPGLFLACCGALWRTPVPAIAWTQFFMPPGTPSEGVTCFAIARDDTHYVGTNTGRIYVGTGKGGWQLGFAHPAGSAVIDLVVDTNDAPSIVYAAFGAEPRVYRFRYTPPPVIVATSATSAVSARARAPVELSFGLLRGLGGAPGLLAPTPITAGLPASVAVRTLAVDAMRPLTIYAGTSQGVFRARSNDNGTTWSFSTYSVGMPPADVQALRVQPTTGLMRAATFGRSAYQVLTGAAVGSLLNISGHITFLRVHDVGTGFGRPPNFLDAEVICLLDSVPWMSFGFQLRADGQRAARREMLALLRAAFKANRPISIDYIRTAPRVGTVIRVMRID